MANWKKPRTLLAAVLDRRPAALNCRLLVRFFTTGRLKSGAERLLKARAELLYSSVTSHELRSCEPPTFAQTAAVTESPTYRTCSGR